MVRVRVKTDTRAMRPKIQSAAKAAQSILDQQVLKDSNMFIPIDTSNSRDSGVRSSRIGEGQLVWDTPYIRKIYYAVRMNFSRDVNPLAGPLWFERAQSAYGSQWARVAQDAMRRGL